MTKMSPGLWKPGTLFLGKPGSLDKIDKHLTSFSDRWNNSGPESFICSAETHAPSTRV